MKKFILALSLVASSLVGAYSRYDFCDNVDLFLSDCRVESEEQYVRLDSILRSFESLDAGEKDIIYSYVCMVINNAQYLECESCCTDEELDDMIQEVWGDCENCC